MVRPLSKGFILSPLKPLLFLIYANAILDCIQSIFKIFANNTSLLSKCQDFQRSELELNEDFAIMWAFQR